MMRALRATLLAVVAALASVSTVSAQNAELRGVVRDSASGVPVAGAVVLVLDASGQTLQRTITGEAGQYRLLRPDAATQLRALRIGFRQRTIMLADVRNVASSFDIALTTIPRLLDAMTVTAARGCPVRADRAEAFGLLDQTRAGLLAAVVAREQTPAAIRMLRFERRLDLDGVEIETQEVEMDSSLRAATSFNAAHSAFDFVERGFRTGENGAYTYYGPDADVLLDERFQRGYCFSVSRSDEGRAGQVGLRFTPAQKRRGRIDVDGTIWIDTTTRTLRELEFRYVGLEGLEAAFGMGGRVRYHTMPNGVAFIQHWSLRLLGAPLRSGGNKASQLYSIREIGGEVAEARWRDGTTYFARLGVAHITATTSDGDPARYTTLRMADTDYRVTTDGSGRATFTDLVPGPYRLIVEHPDLTPVSLNIPTARQLIVRGASSALLRVVVPSLSEYVGSLCGADTTAGSSALLLMRFAGTNNEPLSNVAYTLGQTIEGQRRPLNMSVMAPPGGVVARCTALNHGSLIDVSAWRNERNIPREVVRRQQTLENDVTVMLVSLPTTSTVASSASASPTVVVTGSVRDSAQQRTVAEARVTFVGTPFEGATDYSGRFIVGGVPPGEYEVEVSTPWLDSIGAVTRSTVTVAENRALSLYTPVLDALLRDACGETSGTGALVGRVRTRNASTIPGNVLVVASWPDLPRRALTAGSARATVEPNGRYRVCGVPTDVDVQLHTVTGANADSPVAPAPSVVTARIALARRFARRDLVLDVGTPERDLACLAGVPEGFTTQRADVCLPRPLPFNHLPRSR